MIWPVSVTASPTRRAVSADSCTFFAAAFTVRSGFLAAATTFFAVRLTAVVAPAFFLAPPFLAAPLRAGLLFLAELFFAALLRAVLLRAVLLRAVLFLAVLF